MLSSTINTRQQSCVRAILVRYPCAYLVPRSEQGVTAVADLWCHCTHVLRGMEANYSTIEPATGLPSDNDGMSYLGGCARMIRDTVHCPSGYLVPRTARRLLMADRPCCDRGLREETAYIHYCKTGEPSTSTGLPSDNDYMVIPERDCVQTIFACYILVNQHDAVSWWISIVPRRVMSTYDMMQLHARPTRGGGRIVSQVNPMRVFLPASGNDRDNAAEALPRAHRSVLTL